MEWLNKFRIAVELWQGRCTRFRTGAFFFNNSAYISQYFDFNIWNVNYLISKRFILHILKIIFTQYERFKQFYKHRGEPCSGRCTQPHMHFVYSGSTNFYWVYLLNTIFNLHNLYLQAKKIQLKVYNNFLFFSPFFAIYITDMPKQVGFHDDINIGNAPLNAILYTDDTVTSKYFK